MKKKEYKKSLEIVRHFLFKDFNENIRRPPTAYRIFLNEKIIQGFEKDIDPKKVKLEASMEWKRMDLDKKKVYLEKKKINDDWFEKAKNIKKFTPISVFIQKMFENAKGKKEHLPKMAEISKRWKELKASEKKV